MTDTTDLVRQMRDALDDARDDVQVELVMCQQRAGYPKTDRELSAQIALARRVDDAIAAADDWLSQQPTNQCGETCERAALCATCARGLEQSRVPLTDEWLLDAAGETLYLHHRNEVDSLVRACAEAWGVTLADGIGQTAREDKQ